jgi:ACS family hexuronate transporter-like MFS transporter
MDRQVLGVLKTTLQHDLGWNEIEYSNLVTAFQAAYAIGMLAVGWLVDRLGAKVGYALAMIFWSVAAIAHAGCASLTSFLVARSALGFWEAGVFPASIKAVADWFPRKERALATGIFNAGTSVGAMATPLLVPWITLRWGWRWAFVGTGALGVLWLVLWLTFYRKPEEDSRVSQAELAYIRSDRHAPLQAIRWSQLLPLRQTWAFVIGKFMLDPIWWFYLFWVPDFLQRKHGLALAQIGLPLVIIYLISDVGSIAGG